MRGAIVLAGGRSVRMGEPKAFLAVGGRPLVARVLDAVGPAVDATVLVGRAGIADRLRRTFGDRARVVRDARRVRSPLVGLEAGAAALDAGYVLAVPCDLPFLRTAVVRHLFVEARGRDAAIPRWPDGNLEPLVAVYRRRALLAAVRASLAAGERSNLAMVARLRAVRFVPVGDLRDVDPRLRSFTNVNVPADLARARRAARR